MSYISAGPAPVLTSVQVISVSSDADPSPILVSENYPYPVQENKIFKGRYLRITTRFMGYPRWNSIVYHNGTGTGTGKKLNAKEINSTPIEDAYRNIVGYNQTVEIPFSDFSGNPVTITVTADSSKFKTGYPRSRSGGVSNIQIKK